jgi:hypothetical protein
MAMNIKFISTALTAKQDRAILLHVRVTFIFTELMRLLDGRERVAVTVPVTASGPPGPRRRSRRAG